MANSSSEAYANRKLAVPVEVFPTRVRATGHGIAAASGKCGAVLTAFAFGSATNAMGFKGILGLFSGIMALCALFTLWIPEARGKSLQDIEDEALYGEKPGGSIDVSVSTSLKT